MQPWWTEGQKNKKIKNPSPNFWVALIISDQSSLQWYLCLFQQDFTYIHIISMLAGGGFYQTGSLRVDLCWRSAVFRSGFMFDKQPPSILINNALLCSLMQDWRTAASLCVTHSHYWSLNSHAVNSVTVFMILSLLIKYMCFAIYPYKEGTDNDDDDDDEGHTLHTVYSDSYGRRSY